MKSALFVVDLQKDFCDGGVLPAKNTLSLIAPLNEAIEFCVRRAIICVFTRDWHPPNHCSFRSQGGPWPIHCVQGTIGAEFAHDLHFPPASLVIDIEKDQDVKNMSYSAFENTHLETELRRLCVNSLAVCGIATDYCVKATVLDALRCGFQVAVLSDLIRPINVNANDDIVALGEMKTGGAEIMTASTWMGWIRDSE